MSAIAPVMTPVFELLHRAFLRLLLADVRWSLRDIHPLDPARHALEGRKAMLERKLG